MQIVIGGAHNGKEAHVKKMLAGVEHLWLNCQSGDGDSPLHNFNTLSDVPLTKTLVIEHIEYWLAETELSEVDAKDVILKAVEGRNVIFILTDIGRGIVPMDAKQRALRDACGRLYQLLMARADEVTRIWYGIAQTVKKRGESL